MAGFLVDVVQFLLLFCGYPFEMLWFCKSRRFSVALFLSMVMLAFSISWWWFGFFSVVAVLGIYPPSTPLLFFLSFLSTHSPGPPPPPPPPTPHHPPPLEGPLFPLKSELSGPLETIQFIPFPPIFCTLGLHGPAGTTASSNLFQRCFCKAKPRSPPLATVGNTIFSQNQNCQHPLKTPPPTLLTHHFPNSPPPPRTGLAVPFFCSHTS